MNVAIFGASGATGLLLTQICLDRGDHLAALVRNPTRFPFVDRVRVVQGSAFDADRIRRTIEGADAVLSALGQRTLGNERLLERSVPLLLSAMKQTGVRRIVALGAANISPAAYQGYSAPVRWLLSKVVFGTILKWPTHDQQMQREILSASGLDWTMVLPPRLTNGHGRGTWRTQEDRLPEHGSRIARADVAAFMVQQIASPDWVGKAVYVSW